MRKKSFRYGMWSVLAILVVGVLLIAFRPKPIAVDLAEVREQEVRITVSDEGNAEVREVYRISAPVAGRLLRVKGEVGDIVIAGTTELARIEPAAPVFLDVRTEAEARAALEAARASNSLAAAEWERAQAELEFAGVELDRSRSLFAKGTIAKQKLDDAEREHRVAGADLLTAQARLDQRMHEFEVAKARLVSPAARAEDRKDCECLVLRAPVDGEILRVLEESEITLEAGAGIVEIGDPRNLQIVVDLLSEDAVRVVPGLNATIDGWGGAPLKAIVRRIEPYGYTKVSALGIDEQRVDVLLDLIDPPESWSRLGHGYRVDVSIILQELNALAVPIGAIYREGKDWATFVIEDGRARQKMIELGSRNAEVAEVVSGLSRGDQVILYPSDQVTDGIRIEQR